MYGKNLRVLQLPGRGREGPEPSSEGAEEGGVVRGDDSGKGKGSGEGEEMWKDR